VNTSLSDPIVSIIIVNWNVADLLDRCLASLFGNATDVSWEAVIVDNNSSGTSFQEVRNKYVGDSRLIWIANNENIGNLAVSQAWPLCRGRYLLELGPDVSILPSAVSRMTEFLDGHPEAGAVTARLLNPDGTPQNYYFKPWNLAMCFLTTGLGKTIDQKMFGGRKADKYFGRHVDSRKITEVDQPATVCFLAKREAMGPEGPLDERFPFYFEDADICKRIRGRGFKIFLLPSAEVIHNQGASYNQRDGAWRDREFRRGAVLYFRKYYPGKVVFLKILFLIASSAKFISTSFSLARKAQ